MDPNATAPASEPRSTTSSATRTESGSTTPDDTSTSSTGILGNDYKQCSTAHSASSILTVTEIVNGSSSTKQLPAPTIGTLDWEGDPSVTKTFHGGRVSKSGRIVNECISASFDPRNLHCVGCDTPHHILNPLKKPVIIFSDQNFVLFMNGGPENCMAVFRAENVSLSELADLAAEVLEKNNPPLRHSTAFRIRVSPF
jgi:hypothetical protein